MSSCSATAQRSFKTIIEKGSSSLVLGPFSVQLTRLDDMGHLNLTITKESRGTESSLCAFSGKMFGKVSVLMALVPKKRCQ